MNIWRRLTGQDEKAQATQPCLHDGVHEPRYNDMNDQRKGIPPTSFICAKCKKPLTLSEAETARARKQQ